jgi:phosphohistidine phosphatase
MKFLQILRHAKTEKAQASPRDFDRELLPRGHKQLEDLSYHRLEKLKEADLILCSTARRTRMTLADLSSGLAGIPVEFLDELYLASDQGLLQIVNNLSNSLDNVLIIGHNDGLSDMVGNLVGSMIHMPTSGYVELEFPFDDWPLVSPDTGIMTDHFFSTAR